MFKEMNYDEMMKVDGGHTGWNERPENIDPVRENRDMKIAAIAVVTSGGNLFTGLSSAFSGMLADRLLN